MSKIDIRPEHPSAIALDFDGVCKLFTEHKHQIMSTLLFLHFPEFQQFSLEEYRKYYGYVNFCSKDYAGKARFLCINGLADFIETENGCKCRLSGLDHAIKKLTADGIKVNAASLKRFSDDNDVRRALEWSCEVDSKVGKLTGIGLTPGIKEYILDPFKENVDFYLVSTATESSIRASMEQEDVFFIKRYFGQETATKTEALTLLSHSGYKHVFMFGDSVEDRRASKAAFEQKPEDVNLFFVPVIPGDEKHSFEEGLQIITEAMLGNISEATRISNNRADEFIGKEVGSQWGKYK